MDAPKGLVPIEKLKQVLSGLFSVPKAEIDEAEARRLKRPSPIRAGGENGRRS